MTIDVLDLGLRQLVEIAQREGIIPLDQTSDVEITRLDESGEITTVIMTVNPSMTPNPDLATV